MIKKQVKWIIILAAAVVLVIGGILLIQLLPDPAENVSETTLPEYEIGIVGYERNNARDDIEVMTLTNDDRVLHLRPLNDGEYVESQKWTIDEFSGRESAKWAVNDLALNFYNITASAKLENITEADLSRYGLNTPDSVISIRFLDGVEFTYRFGAKTPVTGAISGYYMMRNDDPCVYVVEDYYYEQLQVELPDLLGLYITDELDDVDSIEEMRFYGPGYADEMVVRYVPEADRNAGTGAKFRFSVPFERDVDDTEFLEIVDDLYYLNAYDVAEAYDQGIPEDVLAEYGLTTPSKCISYTYKGVTTTLKVGKADEAYAYVIYNDEPIIYQVAYTSIDSWYETAVEKLAIRTIYISKIDSVETMTFNTTFKDFAFKLSLAGEVTNNVTLNGKRISLDDFRTFFADFSAVTYIERAPGRSVEGDAEMTITVNLRDGTTDVIRFIKVSARRYHAVVNGKGGVLVSYDDVDAILDALIGLDKTPLT